LSIVDKSVKNIETACRFGIGLFTLKKGNKVANQFGDRVRQLREQQNLLLRQVAPLLEMDTPQLSKIERGERFAKREQVTAMCKIFKVPSEDLLSLWLADKVYDMVKDEDVALRAMEVAEKEIISKKKNPKK
jgi:transcriptional regulator with XRE-family HTH domain